MFEKVFSSGVRERDEIFVTSKLWNTAHRAEQVMPALKESLHDLQLDYLDLYLMHWGVAAPKEEAFDQNGVYVTDSVSVRETWEAMEELVSAGLVRDIGVANFTAPMLIDLLTYAKVQPAVNQIEIHPYFAQLELVQYCKSRGVAVTAYCPLGSPGNFGTKGIPMSIADPAIVVIAERHHKSPAQVILRWGIQRGTVVIPKSTNPERIKENISIFDFVLEDDEMTAINNLNRGLRLVNRNHDWKIPYFD